MINSSIMRRTINGRTRVVGIRIGADERTLTAWGRISGRDAADIRNRLNTMTPYDAVFEGTHIVQPNQAWPVPPSTLAKTMNRGV